LLLVAGGASAAPRTRWTTLADCAGAYVANSRIADPNRLAAMTGQMNETAQDYANAASRAYRLRVASSAHRADAVVGRRIEATAKRLSKRSRETAEKLIDACPQVGS
jgi:hypothetical protein